MKNLRQLRKDQKMTLEEAARYLGIDSSGLSRIERGFQYPRMKTANKLADLYNISIGDVFNRLPQLNKKTA